MNNEEHLVVARDLDAVLVHEGWFQDLWDKAEILTVEGVTCACPGGLLFRRAQKPAMEP